MQNKIITIGKHSQAVPTADGVVVHIYDEHHFGTLVVLIKKGITDVFPEYFFFDVEEQNKRSPRCALIEMGWAPDAGSLVLCVSSRGVPHWMRMNYGDSDASTRRYEHGYGIDINTGVGLFGCGMDDDISRIGEVLWDSAAAAVD